MRESTISSVEIALTIIRRAVRCSPMLAVVVVAAVQNWGKAMRAKTRMPVQNKNTIFVVSNHPNINSNS